LICEVHWYLADCKLKNNKNYSNANAHEQHRSITSSLTAALFELPTRCSHTCCAHVRSLGFEVPNARVAEVDNQKQGVAAAEVQEFFQWQSFRASEVDTTLIDLRTFF
jgi:hypothetical protein